MKKLLKAGAIVVAMAVIAGCTTFQLSGVSVVEDMPAMSPIGDFETQVTILEFLGNSGGANFLNVTATEMDNEIYDAIRREIERRSGDAAINVTIKYEATPVNLLINGLTGNLVAPATATITGTIVSYN